MTLQFSCVILAAGRGQRLSPLTDSVPKPALPINGRPVISQIYAQVVEIGFKDLTIVVGYKEEIIRKIIQKTIEHSADVQMPLFVQEPVLRGSGFALQCAYRAREEIGDSLILAADTIFSKEEIRAACKAFSNSDFLGLMCVHKEPKEKLPKGKCVRVEDGKVISVSENARNEQEWAAAPMFLIKKELWEYVNNLEGEILEFAYALQNAIDDGHKIGIFPITKSWEITTSEGFLKANFAYLHDLLE